MSDTDKRQHVALYRKYRSKSFDDVVGQEHITVPLQRAVEQGRVSHGYLLVGPHGVGKTSVARIFAHAINNLPYESESNHIDIIEIDAASNRRIDEIRDLREKAYISPVQAQYKVYIIDEVHMLTKEAFNALLKTLEEPPAHVVFILATTELHKLPSTIISRTQRHTFKPVNQAHMVERLKRIADAEGISIDEPALDLIASHARGSLRDGVSLLDQVASLSLEIIGVEDVEAMLGLASTTQISALLEATLSGDISGTSESLRAILFAGAQPEIIASQLVQLLREHSAFLSNILLVDALLGVAKSASPDVRLEIALLQHCLPVNGVGLSQTTDTTALPEPTVVVTEPEIPQTHKEQTPHATPESSMREKQQIKPTSQRAHSDQREEKSEQVAASANNKPAKTTPHVGALTEDAWQKVIESVKSRNNAIASILRGAKVTFDDTACNVMVAFSFHKKKLEAAETLTMISDASMEAIGRELSLSVSVGKVQARAEQPSHDTAPNQEDDLADKIIATFGGGEKLEM